MARKTGDDYDYLEDAFDDRKNEAALLEAKKANQRGCLIALIVGIFVPIIILIISFGVTSSIFSS